MIYTLESEPPLTAPVMVSALTGWVDAAAAGTSAAGYFGSEGSPVVTFDPDALFDYRSQRPILDIVDGAMRDPVWPEVGIRHAPVGGRDVLVLTGQEPDLRWNEFGSSIADLVIRFGVTQLVTLGAVPAAVPHTMPSPVLTTGSNIELMGDVRKPEGLLRVPAAAVNIVDHHVRNAGIPTVGFWVQVPHYVSAPYSPAVLALVERAAHHLGVEVDLEPLQQQAAMQRTQLDELVAGQPDAVDHVRRLEEIATEERVVSGEELASEIEKYLREASPGERGPFDEGASGT